MQILLQSLFFMVIWVLISTNLSISNFILGYLISFLMLAMIGVPVRLKLRTLPSQIFWSFYFVIYILVDLFKSGFDVAARIIRPTMKINPGIIRVSTQDPSRSTIISAIAGSAITLTPGELVAAYDEDDEQGIIMYVHCLDVEASAKTIEKDQARRAELIKRILGL